MGGAHRSGERRRRDRPADLPTGEGECLAEAAEHDGALAHARLGRQGSMRRFVPEFLVDLVADDDEIKLVCDAHDRGAFSIVENSPARIVRAVDQQHARLRGDCCSQRNFVDAKSWRFEGHDLGHAPRHDNRRRVGIVERLEQNDLIARLKQREHAVDDRFGCAASHHHIAFGVVGQSTGPLETIDDCLGQFGKPRHAGVLSASIADRLDRCFLEELRTVEVGCALTEVERVVLDRQRGHFSEDRCPEWFQPRVHTEVAHGPIVPPLARIGRLGR